MTLLFKQIFGFLKLLNSDTGTISLAMGVALGFVLGMSPMLSLQGILILLIAIFFRVQLGAVFISSFFFAFVAYLLDPAFHALGEKILLNLLENASPKWCFRLERKKSISVYPSIRRTLGCRSHFWLKNGKIYFVSHSEAPSSISSKTFQKLFP